MIDLAQELETNVKKHGFFKRWLKRLRRALSLIFSFGSLVVLLALLTAIPVVQFIAFGYLLDVSGRLKNGCKLSDSLPKMHQAGIVGLAAIAIIIAALPSQLLTHWESVAHIIDADSRQAALLRGAAIASSIVATFYLLWAWIRGGRLKCYLWPQPKRLFSEGWRWSTWKNAPDQLWNFTTAFELPRYFWIGLRGAVGTLIWLAPTIVIILAFREGESGLAGLVGFLAILCLAFSLFYLPLLQTHFAAENRLSAIFERKKVRQLFSAAPWATFLAMVFALFITPIPLYLLKIEATPQPPLPSPTANSLPLLPHHQEMYK